MQNVMSDIDEKENSFRVRQKPPGQFVRFRVQPLPKSAGVQMAIGFKPDGGSEIQSLIFSKSKFTTDESVRTWIEAHENFKLAEIELGDVEKFTEDMDYYADPTPIGKNFKKIFIAREISLKFRRGITKNDLEQMKKNFDDNVVGRKIDIDFAHKEDPALGTKAAGWIEDTVIEDIDIDGKKVSALFGIPEWTPAGEKSVSEGEFKYISPEINFSFVNPETGTKHGTTLKSVGILNNPQIPNQPVIELFKAQKTSKKEEKMDKLKELLEKKEVKISDEEVTEAILVTKFTEILDAKDTEIKKISDDKKAVDTKLKESDTKLKEATDNMSDKDTKFNELSETVKTMKEVKAAEDIQTLCEKAITSKKITPAQANFKEGKGFFFEMFKSNVSDGDKYLAEMPVIVVNANSHSDDLKDGDKSDSDKLNEEVEAEMTKFSSDNGGKTQTYQEAYDKVMDRKSVEGGNE